MSKELTEKYYDCQLEDGFYYAKSNDDDNTFIVEEYPWDDKRYYNCEILGPVPSYDEFQRLQEQLNEANNIIVKADWDCDYALQSKCGFSDYLKKYDVRGVK